MSEHVIKALLEQNDELKERILDLETSLASCIKMIEDYEIDASTLRAARNMLKKDD
jgi:hypothetical protein